MRVIAGELKGRPLLAPRGWKVRPTSDRVREAIFSALGEAVEGARVLDLYCGTGALAIEALSRGAARATFVERDRRVVGTIAENLARTGLAGERAQVVRADAAEWLTGHSGGPFGLVFIDPPYADVDLLGRLLAILGDDRDGRLLVPGARVVAKHFWRDRPPPAVGLLASERDRRFGETGLTFYRREGG
jgi:16S rRNA (guanine(966)-N(2))-methyltransferase RsmD